MKTLVSCLAAILLAVGCNQPSSPVAEKPAGATTTPSSPPETPPTTTQAAPDKTTSAASTSTDSAPTLDQIPADVKTDAFAYEGLANDKMQHFEDTMSKHKNATGTFQVKLKEIKDGKATFEEVATGGIEGGQTEDMSADSTGIYHEKLSPFTLKTPHVIELPAKLAPGDTWKDKTTIDAEGNVISTSSVNKVIGMKKITTKLGSFDALEIDSPGDGTFQGKPIKVDLKRWFVKDVGVVRQTETMKLPGSTTTVTREFTK